MKTNRDHYEELVHAMKERGVDWGLEASIRATDSGDTGTYDLGLGLEERSEVERFKRSQWNARMGKMQIGGDEHICAAGITNVHVQPNGAITPCVVWPMEVGHLEKGSLSHIWKKAPTGASMGVGASMWRVPESSCVWIPLIPSHVESEIPTLGPIGYCSPSISMLSDACMWVARPLWPSRHTLAISHSSANGGESSDGIASTTRNAMVMAPANASAADSAFTWLRVRE